MAIEIKTGLIPLVEGSCEIISSVQNKKFIYDFILRVYPCLPIVINLYSNKEFSLTGVKYERSESRRWHFYKILIVFFR